MKNKGLPQEYIRSLMSRGTSQFTKDLNCVEIIGIKKIQVIFTK